MSVVTRSLRKRSQKLQNRALRRMHRVLSSTRTGDSTWRSALLLWLHLRYAYSPKVFRLVRHSGRHSHQYFSRPLKSLSYQAILISLIQAALDATSLSVALPIIAQKLKGTAIEAFWSGTSFLLTSTVFQVNNKKKFSFITLILNQNLSPAMPRSPISSAGSPWFSWP